MLMFCPYCDKEHNVNVIKKDTSCIINNEKIDYIEQVYYCDNSNKYFYDGLMDDENLLRARDEYRKKHNLLTSLEIKQKRNKLNLSQNEFSLVLGFKENLIKNFESKQIQSIEEDNLIRNY